MADFVRLDHVTDPAGSEPVASDEFRTRGTWRWYFPDGGEYVALATFIGIVDPGTVGEVRFHVPETGQFTPPLSFDSPTGVIELWLALPVSANATVHVEARRVSGGGAVRIVQAAVSAAPASMVSGEPRFLTDPAIVGTARVGATLTRVDAVVTGFPVPDVSYQWLRDDAPISGQTGATLDIQAGWEGSRIGLQAMAVNTEGVDVAYAAQTEVITGQPTPTAATDVTVGGAATGGVADLGGPVVVAATFNSPEPTDYPTQVAIRRKLTSSGTYGYVNLATGAVSGSEVWNPVTDRAEEFTVPAGVYANGSAWDTGVRYQGRFGTSGPYGTDVTVTGSAKPTFTVVNPVGTIDATRPVLYATYADPEGDVQTARRWIVATRAVADAAGYSGTASFNAETIEAESRLWDSDWITGTATTDTVPVTLDDNESYVVFGQAHASGVESEWSASAFDVDVPEPAAPLLAASDDNADGDVAVVVTSRANQLIPNRALSADATGLSGWAAGAATTGVAYDAGRMKLSTASAGDLEVELTGPVVQAGQVHALYAEVRLDEGQPRDWVAQIEWLNASDGVISTATSATVREPSTGTPAPDRTFTLQRADTASYAGATPLEGSTVSQPVAVRLLPADSSVNTLISSVTFYIRQTSGGVFTSYSSDTSSPWEMQSGGTVPTSAFGSNGQKTVRATVTYNDGTPAQNVEATFTLSVPTTGTLTLADIEYDFFGPVTRTDGASKDGIRLGQPPFGKHEGVLRHGKTSWDWYHGVRWGQPPTKDYANVWGQLFATPSNSVWNCRIQVRRVGLYLLNGSNQWVKPKGNTDDTSPDGGPYHSDPSFGGEGGANWRSEGSGQGWSHSLAGMQGEPASGFALMHWFYGSSFSNRVPIPSNNKAILVYAQMRLIQDTGSVALDDAEFVASFGSDCWPNQTGPKPQGTQVSAFIQPRMKLVTSQWQWFTGFTLASWFAGGIAYSKITPQTLRDFPPPLVGLPKSS